MQLALFPLIHSTILHNWNYFFPASTAISQIARMRQQLDRNATIGDENKTGHEEEFVALLGCVATSFRQWTLTLFRHNLAMLEDLHSKSQLFQQVLVQVKIVDSCIILLCFA